MPDLTGGSADWSSLFGGFAANGGRIGYSAGGIPGLNDLKQGYAGIPGNEGMETPMSQVVAGGTKTPTELKAEMDRMSGGSGGSELSSPMQGTVVKIAVEVGAIVEAGDLIIVLEAMKMEQPLMAHKSGVIANLTAVIGATVSSGTTLCDIIDA